MMNITGAYCNGKHLAVKTYEHTTCSVFFEQWFSQVLLQEVPDGFTIIMDNASFHREAALLSLIKGSGKNISLLFLPPYSPDFNPIEKSWGNLKKFLRHFSSNFDSLYLAISLFFLLA
jgi:transposase